ncbi:MAG: glycosyltransferase family 4 protein [Butyrivibrio sp.]|jgi:hypothetical protein|nr:glycosyltransferase family 4 protein [Butyrivibrio sp.]
MEIKKKNLLIYAHYYVPDVASTGQILRELAEGMLGRFNVTVICVVPSYTGKIAPEYQTEKYYYETLNGVNVIRIRVPEFDKHSKKSRIKNILSYFLGAIKLTFKLEKQDYIISISQPPVLGGLLGVIGKQIMHSKYIYDVQDFNPEQIMAVKYSNNSFILKLMLAIDKFSCRCADKDIVVGRDMVETLKNRFDNKKMPQFSCINNWVDEAAIYPLPQNDMHVQEFKKEYHLENKFVVMYSGNLGLYYDLKNIIQVIEKVQERGSAYTSDGREVVFAFVGAGSILGELEAYKKEHQLHNVVFIPYQVKEDLIYSLNAADVHLCVSAKGIKGVSVPSKVYGIMGVAKPILGVMEEGSEARLLIDETGCGICSSPEDYDSLEKNIQWFIEHADSEELHFMGERGREYLERHLTKAKSVSKYEAEILSC